MSTATMQQPPVIPPRPSRSQDKDASSSSTAAAATAAMPRVPPRPIVNNRRAAERSISPSRFAPSPLNDSPLTMSRSPKFTRSSPGGGHGFPSDPIERVPSVSMPSLGEEGMEYAALTTAADDEASQTMRTVGDDVKLHAPKPSLPAQSAKARVAAVTRTDSDKAAAFGIGKASIDESLGGGPASKSSLKKKGSTASGISESDSHFDEEHGIPEIGQRVPMLAGAGDVQAPSPGPGSVSGITEGLKTARHHGRKPSARGFAELPPGSYGLHGHHVAPQDKLQKAYYDKHPELLGKEHCVPLHDRQNNFAMSSEELNKIVRETASIGSGIGTTSFNGTPSEQVGYQAHEEYASRMSSPRPSSTAPKSEKSATSAKRISFKPEISVSSADEDPHGSQESIHVDEPRRRPSYDASTPGEESDEGVGYAAPILAADELAKAPSPYDSLQPAIEPLPERRGSVFEIEQPTSRPTSRPASIYREASAEQVQSTPLEDVQEYEPLFDDDKKQASEAAAAKPPNKESMQRFPSRDIWEDAPNSVHATVEVSTPDVPATASSSTKPDLPDRAAAETPAQAFARHQEELAEKEFRGVGLPRSGGGGDSPEMIKRSPPQPEIQPLWAQPHRSHLMAEAGGGRGSGSGLGAASRPGMAQRFPSRDIWEDVPDSLALETTVAGPQSDHGDDESRPAKPDVPSRPARKSSADTPAVPGRPKPKHLPSDEAVPSAATAKPVVPERPKPAIPARPAKAGLSASESKDKEVGDTAPPPPSSKAKPAVPARPVGSKIAALQAGFMSDLNERLRLGPQGPPAPKKEDDPVAPDAPAAAEKEKIPLADARKGRARGPQRRAPASKSPAPAAALEPAPEKKEPVQLAFSSVTTVWALDPDDGEVSIVGDKAVDAEEPVKDEAVAESAAVASEPAVEPAPAEAADVKPTTLATNTAGEPVVEAPLVKDAEQAEPAGVEDVAKD